jgi:hypothetical protein
MLILGPLICISNVLTLELIVCLQITSVSDQSVRYKFCKRTPPYRYELERNSQSGVGKWPVLLTC